MCRDIAQPAKPWQILQILKGLPSDDAFAVVSDLVSRGLLLLDWAESEVDALVLLDEDKAWPRVLQMIERGENWKLRSVIGKLSARRQLECVTLWLPTLKDRWFFEQILTTLHNNPSPREAKSEALRQLRLAVTKFAGRYDDKLLMVQRIDSDSKALDDSDTGLDNSRVVSHP